MTRPRAPGSRQGRLGTRGRGPLPVICRARKNFAFFILNFSFFAVSPQMRSYLCRKKLLIPNC